MDTYIYTRIHYVSIKTFSHEHIYYASPYIIERLSDRKKLSLANQETGVSQSIMEAQLRTPLKLLNTIVCCDAQRVQGGPQLVHTIPRDTSLSDTPKFDRFCSPRSGREDPGAFDTEA